MKPTRAWLAGILGVVLIGAADLSWGQGVPRDEFPLPPGTDIGPRPEADVGDDAAADRVAGFADMQSARDVFDEILRAYESGNVARIQRRLDPSMVGYQVFLDGVRRDVNALKNRRINLTDTQITAGPDLAVIQTGWEKRFLGVTDFRPGIHTGRSTILMHRDKDGWRLAALARDNLFASAAGTLARFTVMPMAVALGRLVAPSMVQVEVVDPDMTGLPSVQIAVTGSDGDRETLVLPATTPGTFRVTTLDIAFRPDGVVPGDGILDFSGMAGTFTLSYVDANPGENRPPSTLSRVLQVQGASF